MDHPPRENLLGALRAPNKFPKRMKRARSSSDTIRPYKSMRQAEQAYGRWLDRVIEELNEEPAKALLLEYMSSGGFATIKMLVDYLTVRDAKKLIELIEDGPEWIDARYQMALLEWVYDHAHFREV